LGESLLASCAETDKVPLNGGKDCRGSWMGSGVGCSYQQGSAIDQEIAAIWEGLNLSPLPR